MLSVRELIEKAQSAPGVDWRALSSDGPLRHTARSNARECARMFSEGDSLAACWRFGILQSLDDYASTVRRRGLDLGAMVFAREPEPTGSHEIDAAFAALADHLSGRDGWTCPASSSWQDFLGFECRGGGVGQAQVHLLGPVP